MADYLANYLNGLNNPELAVSVRQTVSGYLEKLAGTSAKKKIRNTLLLGNVQSGKTAQVLGLISALAEDGQYRFFLYLTTDSIDLQQQTLERVKDSLPEFHVLAENDLHQFDAYFRSGKPIIAVIKKTAAF